MNVFDLFGRLTIDGIEKADGQLASIEGRFKSAGQSMTNMGKKMSMYVTAPIVGVGIAAFKMAGDFDQAFRQVNVMLDASAQEAENYKARILEISSATGKAVADVTEAYYQIVSAGYRGADSLDILETAMRGATGGAADATTTTAALTKAMNIFELQGVHGATKAMDTFFGIVDSGLLSFEEMATAFPRAASNAAGLGISIEATGATLATLTKVLGSTEQAATATDAIFRTLISPSEAMLALYEKWGVSSGPEAIKQFGGLNGVLAELQQETGGNVVAIRELFASDEAMRGALPLLTSSFDDFGAALDTVSEATGRTGEAFDLMTQGAGWQWQQFTNNMSNATIKLGGAIADTLGPALVSLTEFVTKAVDAFSNLSAPVRNAITVTLGLAAVMGPLLITFGFAAQGVASMIGLYHWLTLKILGHTAATIASTTATQGATVAQVGFNTAVKANPIGLIITAVSLLVAGLIALHNNWDWVVSRFKGGVSESEKAFEDFANTVRDNAEFMVSEVDSAFEQQKASAVSSADMQISSLEQVRDAEKRAIDERLGYYEDFTADKLEQIDKAMIAELAAIDGELGEKAQAYLDSLEELDAADEKREDEKERLRIRGLKRELAADDDLSKSRKLSLEDDIADYEAKLEREKGADRLFADIKESDLEKHFADEKTALDTKFDTDSANIILLRDQQVNAYRDRRDAFRTMAEGDMEDWQTLISYAQVYNDIMGGAGREGMEIPEFPGAGGQGQPSSLAGLGFGRYAGGGDITEPTLLYGLRSQKPYAIAGEAGPERVVPQGQGTITNNFSIAQLVVREEADVRRVARELYKLQSMKGQYA